MELKTVKSKADADKLIWGDPWAWDLPEDPLEAAARAEELEADLGAYIDDRFSAELTVTFDETHVTIVSDRDTVVQLGGDVKDRSGKLTADKPKKCKLTAEGNGFVTVNGIEYEVA